MTSKTFVSGTVIDSAWLNDVNDNTYGPTAPTGTLRGDLAASSGASLVGGGDQVVASIVALRSLLKTSASKNAFVTGYYAAGDGGGGAYWYDSTDITSADNGGSVIVATDGGRWKLQIHSYIAIEQFGARCDGAADDTAAINLAGTAAYKFAANTLSPYGEIYSVTVMSRPGRDIKISGKVLVPSQVIFDFNGSRLLGTDATAGSTAYNPAGQHMFETAYYDGTNVVSNAAAATPQTWRVVGAGIKNATVANCNCPVNAINLQEQSLLDGLRFSNCSSLGRLQDCFYLRVGRQVPLIARTCSQAAGQWAWLLHGSAAHEMKFDCRIVGASISYEVTATNSFSVQIDGSMEEGYASGSIGIRNNGAYCQAWRVNAYCEGVRKGIVTINSGAFFASAFTPAYFSSCEYAVQAGISGFRSCTWDCLSAPDEGVGIRNLVDFSAPNNDVIVRRTAKGADTTSGPTAYPSNVLLGAGCKSIGQSFWKDTTDATPGTNVLALCDSRLSNLSEVGEFAFEGAQIVTKANQPPFVSLVKAVNTLTVNTILTYDTSNILAFNFYGGTDSVNYVLSGFIFGATVSWLTHDPIGVVLTVNNNAGYVQLVFSNLTAAVPVINVSGCVRHV